MLVTTSKVPCERASMGNEGMVVLAMRTTKVRRCLVDARQRRGYAR